MRSSVSKRARRVSAVARPAKKSGPRDTHILVGLTDRLPKQNKGLRESPVSYSRLTFSAAC